MITTDIDIKEYKELLNFNNKLMEMSNDVYISNGASITALPETATADKELFDYLKKICQKGEIDNALEECTTTALTAYEKQGFYYGFKAAVELLQHPITV